MKPRCIEAVTKSAGRALSAVEIKGIEDRILGNMKYLAKNDRMAWSKLSSSERLDKASAMASDQLVNAAVRKKQALIQNARIIADTQAYFAERVAAGDTNITALQRMLAPLRDLQGGTQSLSQDILGIGADLKRNLWDVLDVTGKFGGLMQNREGLVDFMKERFGEDSGNPQAKAASKLWGEASDAARMQMNDEGGAVGYLKKYRAPQTHDPAKTWKMGQDLYVDKKMAQVDRSEYVNIDGSQLTDAEMRTWLGEAWKTITRDGDKEPTGANVGTVRLADQGMQHREIIFKDWQSLLAHESETGTGDPVSLLIGHFDRLASNIAQIKHFGDNPSNMVAHLADIAYRADLEAGGHPDRTKSARNDALKLYDFIAGNHDPVHSEGLKYAADVATGVHVASKLGSAVISAIADQSTMVMAANTNGMPVMQTFRNQLAAFNLGNRGEKVFAQRQGLMNEAMMADVARWGTDNLAQTWAGKMAGTVLKLSVLNTFTAAEKRSHGLGIYDLMGRLSREHDGLASLHEGDRATLDRLGVSDGVFQVWRKAETVSRNSMTDTVLTPDAIYAIPDAEIAAMGVDPSLVAKTRRDAAQALIGVALADMDVAIPTPRARDRFETTGGIQRGTWKGELWRQMALFKATPYAMFREQYGRLMSQDGGYNRAVYGMKFLTLTTMMGAFTVELDQLLNGKDPIDFTKNPVRAGARALLKGGGLGFFGDFLFSDKTLQGQIGALAGVSGPSGSTLEALLKLTVGNASLAFQGKKTHVGADAADLGKSLIPGANLWYLKGALNHLWMHYVQDVLHPGYSQRMEQRAMTDFGQKYWWRPGDLTPARSPNMGAVAGQR